MDRPIIQLTELAVSQIKKIMTQEDCAEQAIRVGISKRSPTGFEYQLEFCDHSERADDDRVLDQDGIVLFVDAASVDDLAGTSIDYSDNGFAAGFKFDNPNKPPLMNDPIAVRVNELIQERVNPGVAAHGGHVTLLDVKDGTAFIELGGGCQGCGQADTTVKQGIEAMILEEVPEITRVLDTTDHAAGLNPYFRG